MRLLALAAVVTLMCCAAPAAPLQLELRVEPSSVDTMKGLVTVTAVGTDEKGLIGKGVVTFSVSVGTLTEQTVTMDDYGKAETVFSCLAGQMPGCDTETSAEITARWNTATNVVVAQRRVTLRQIPPPVLSGDGGVGASCTSRADCLPQLACVGGDGGSICVGSGALRVSLLWTVAADFDLHLKVPGSPGGEIYYANRTVNGGELDVDACVSAPGCRPQNVENIFFAEQPPAGQYTVWVRNYNGRFAGAYTIQVVGPTTTEYTGNLPATPGTDSTRYTFTR